jgi:NADP-dependent 3-hydroxy acid dehydrogenase YdfG
MRYPRIDLAKAVVLITGGGRGIGRATGEAFAALGSTVCLADLDLAAAQDAAAGMKAYAYQADVADRVSFAAVVDAVTEKFGRIDILVNNAGVMPLGAFLTEDQAISRTTFAVNTWGPLNGMQLVMPDMIVRGRGHVVNIASMAGKIPLPGMAVYKASKFATVGLTAAVRREYAGTGVSVSAVLPSAVRTELSSGVRLGGGLPTVDPQDIAAAVIDSCRTRRGEIPVPGYVGSWDLFAALAPEPVMRLGRRLLGDDRALTAVDPAVRASYNRRVGEQAGVPSMDA